MGVKKNNACHKLYNNFFIIYIVLIKIIIIKFIINYKIMYVWNKALFNQTTYDVNLVRFYIRARDYK